MGYAINTKHCATCEYWDGARYNNKKMKIVESTNNEKGTCKNTRSSFKGKTKRSGEMCSYWQKWHEL